MSTPPEDPRVRPARQNRKEKTIVRVGYTADSKDGNHAANQQDTHRFTIAPSARQHFTIQKSPLQKKIKHDGEAHLMPSHEDLSPVIDTATLTQIACEAMQAIQAQSSVPREGSVGPTGTNPLARRRHDEVKAVNSRSNISCAAFPYQAQNSLNSGWLVPIDAPFFQQDKLEQVSFSNIATFFKKEQEPQRQHEKQYDMGVPRNLGTFPRINGALPQYSSTSSRLNYQSHSLQHKKNHNQPSFGNSPNNQSSCPQSFAKKPTPSQINGTAQKALLQFVRNQASVLNSASNGRTFPLSQPTPSGSRSSPIAPSRSRFLDKLRVTLDPFDTSTNNSQKGSAQVNPPNNYFLVLHYLISRQASRNKTTNIHLVLDRLQASIRDWTLPVASVQGGYYMPLQTRVKYMKEYLPYIASIRQWHQDIRNHIHQYQKIITTFRKRTTTVADAKLLLLKSCGAKAKQALNLIKSSVNTYSLVSEETKKTAEMLMADCTNNRGFTFLHPNEDFMLICQNINKDYHSIRNTVQSISSLYPNNPTQQINKLDMGQIIQELADKLVLESGRLCDLKQIFVRLKARYGDRPHQDKKRQQWKLLDLFCEIQTLLKRRASRRNDL